MGFLRRLFGGGEASDPVAAGLEGDEPAAAELDTEAALDASERQHELDLMREEQERLDELTQRQLRYAQYAWQPPAQGGERRADDEDSTAGSR